MSDVNQGSKVPGGLTIPPEVIARLRTNKENIAKAEAAMKALQALGSSFPGAEAALKWAKDTTEGLLKMYGKE